MCVVPINVPNGFSTFLAPPFNTFEPWPRKAKIKPVIVSQVLSCTLVTSTKNVFLLFKCGCKSVISLKKGRVLGTGKCVFLPYLSPGLKSPGIIKLQSIQCNTLFFPEGSEYQGFSELEDFIAFLLAMVKILLSAGTHLYSNTYCW